MIPIVLRKATEQDSAFLLALRNDPAVRQNSFHKELVTPEDHAVWLRHVLADPARTLWIAEHADTGAAIGQLRLDDEGDPGYEISYSVAPDWRGQHVGTVMIGVLMQQLRAEREDVRVFARVLPDNFASQRVFVHNGFVLVRQTDEALEYERTVHAS